MVQRSPHNPTAEYAETQHGKKIMQVLDERKNIDSKVENKLNDARVHKKLLEDRIQEFEKKVFKPEQARFFGSDSEDSDY